MANGIQKTKWQSNFSVTGELKLNSDRSRNFTINEKSKKSAYEYSRMNLSVDCGDEHGIITGFELMGGHFTEKENVIKVFGVREEGMKEFPKVEVAWEDRFDEDVLKTIADMNKIKIGIEKTDKGFTFTKEFLNAGDAIEYCNEHLEDGMVVTIRGNLKFSMYKGTVQPRKEITSIFLSKVEGRENYRANFNMTVLLDKDSVKLNKDHIDMNKGTVRIDTTILDYVQEVNGVEVKGNFPYKMSFEYPMDFKDQDKCKKIMDKIFKVKKNFTQITFQDGKMYEGGNTVSVTLDDLTDDIKEMIGILFTEEEALQKASSRGSREKRYVLGTPLFEKDKEGKIIGMARYEDMYEEEDIYNELVIKAMNNDEEADYETETAEEDEDVNKEAEELKKKKKSTPKVEEEGIEEETSGDSDLEDFLNSL